MLRDTLAPFNRIGRPTLVFRHCLAPGDWLGTTVSSVWITFDWRTRSVISCTSGVASSPAHRIQAHILLRATCTPCRGKIRSNDVVHRDLKPRSVLLSNGSWKIADFGISKNLGRLITQKTFLQHGTLGYGAPEQFDGVEAKPTADIYSVGKIIVFLLTGQTDADYVRFPSWEKLIRKCIAQSPSERPATKEVLATVGAMPS